jgi:hypothetical protein
VKNLSPTTTTRPATAPRFAIALAPFIVAAAMDRVVAQQTAFSYSGVLYATNVSQSGPGPANGTFDFRCSLWPSLAEANSANRIGPTNTFTVQLAAGAFAINLDFGTLTGGPYFLQTEVRRTGIGAFKVLSPRKEILPTPLAQHAQTASNLLGTLSGASLTGTISDARLSPNVALLSGNPNFSGTVTANGFVGDGGGLTGLNGAAIQPGSIANASLADSSLTAGKIAGGQVVKSLNGLNDGVTLSAGPNVTLTPSGNNLQISANSGAGGLSWQVVSGTAQQAQPNTGYLLTNDAQVTLTLPASLNVGDVVRVSGNGAGGWKIAQNAGQTMLIKNPQSAWTPHESDRDWAAIASSADGNKLVAVVSGGQIYTSTDAGMSWTPHASNQGWTCVASSADGSKLVAGVQDGQIYTSTDSGATWTARDSSRYWYAVASSSDGGKLVALVYGGQIYTSTDSGANWTPRESNRVWFSVASSADGSKLSAVENGGQIYISADSGVTWSPRESSRNWSTIASSADGTKLAAVVYDGQIYTSTDSGDNWTPRATSQPWLSVASSADGTRLVAGGNVGPNGAPLYISTDAGMTWQVRDTLRFWGPLASSANGNKLVAIVTRGRIYTSVAISSTLGGAGYLLGERYSPLELQYAGNGLFIATSHEGTLSSY